MSELWSRDMYKWKEEQEKLIWKKLQQKEIERQVQWKLEIEKIKNQQGEDRARHFRQLLREEELKTVVQKHPHSYFEKKICKIKKSGMFFNAKLFVSVIVSIFATLFTLYLLRVI